MQHIPRKSLSARVLRFLRQRTLKVVSHKDPKAEATRLWRLRRSKAFAEIRAALREMAAGRERCMYTGDSEGTDIDHFWPKARYPERTFAWENYLLASSRCNSNDKRDAFPLDENGEPLLINPTVDEPLAHLDLIPINGWYHGRTRKGIESVRIFGLNRGVLIRGRRASWTAIEACLIRYAEAKAASDETEAARCRQAISDLAFPGVFAAYLKIAKGPVTDGIDSRCLRILAEHPEISTWA